jgi:D-arabinose 1-dehydrogenase-like Zn-dependent alcohol dehydrogenase
MRRASAQGIYVGSRADYMQMSAFITRHELKPVIEREFPVERYEEALKLLESGGFVGKIVLNF